MNGSSSALLLAFELELEPHTRSRMEGGSDVAVELSSTASSPTIIARIIAMLATPRRSRESDSGDEEPLVVAAAKLRLRRRLREFVDEGDSNFVSAAAEAKSAIDEGDGSAAPNADDGVVDRDVSIFNSVSSNGTSMRSSRAYNTRQHGREIKSERGYQVSFG